MNNNVSPVGSVFAVLMLACLSSSCGDAGKTFARVFKLGSMAQAIGGPAAAARPGDYVLENDRLRAVIHGRHNERSTLPVGNGNLVDLDIQRPHHRYGAGKGKDAFYEFAPFVNLKITSADAITTGRCNEVGLAPCPPIGTVDGPPETRCARVAVEGRAIDLLGILGLLDIALQRSYPTAEQKLFTDYDLCPGEPFVRVTTRVRFYGATGDVMAMPELKRKFGLPEALLGQYQEFDCKKDACPATHPHCDDLLKPLDFGSLNTTMKRCRADNDTLGGVVAGDITLFSAKARVFLPGNGFDNESHSRTIFDSGGDVFSNPLVLDYMAAVGDGVSYAFFNETGKMMVPVFSASFTAAQTNLLACPQNNPKCFEGKELTFRRYISVGDGSVASALAPFYRLRKMKTGSIRGHLIDQRSRQPLSDQDVFVFKLPKAWEQSSAEDIASKSYQELVAAHRAETRSTDSPSGEPGIVSHFRTDTGLDTRNDGSFAGKLPEGRYVLLARTAERSTSRLLPITIEANERAEVTLTAADEGVLEYVVRDSSGHHLPSKLTIGACMPECARDADCSSDRPICELERRICVASRKESKASCRPDQVWNGTQCNCPTAARLPLELGGGRLSDGVVRTVLTADGRGSVHLPPGTYEVIASRGVEYEIRRRFITVRAGAVARFKANLPRVVDTKGWISADFHVHGPNSVDSGLDYDTRVRSYAAEGVELLSSSDHDHLTDYQPTIFRLGLQPWISSQIGVECSPLDYGHYLGFPLLFNENDELNGAFHWLKSTPGGSPDWQNRPPAEIFELMRERGALEQTMVVIAHFYDAFSFYDLDPFSLELPFFNISSFFNPIVAGRHFSGAFDGLEALSGKNLDVIRRPTYKEIRDYNNQLAALLARKDLDSETLERRWSALSSNAQREFLRRSPAEQKLALAYDNPDFACRCMSDQECGTNGLCDRRTGGCINGCSSARSCDDALVAAGREACQPVDKDPARSQCQRVAKACRSDNDCPLIWTDKGETCVIDAGQPTGSCEMACKGTADCKDPLRPHCDQVQGRCVTKPILAAGDLAPCITVRGTLDDWFQILNRGMRRTVFGNSDSHDTYDAEAGMPRNYVRSSTDQAHGIDRREIVENLHKMQSFATYGPFVEFTIDGEHTGAILRKKPNEGFALAIRVQSPSWFDVDRLEIYRNGELWKVIEGREDCQPNDAGCLLSPNKRVLNYQAELEDQVDEDSWYVVVAMGLDGKSLAPVYSSPPVARLGMFELIQRLTPILPPLASLRIPLSPTIGLVRPYAVTNPIYIDVDGDGIFKARGTLPTWMPAAEKELQSKASGLRTATQRHSHHSHGKMRHAKEHSHGLIRHRHGRGDAARVARQIKRRARGLTPSQRKRLDELLGEPHGHDHRQGLGRTSRRAKKFTQAAKEGLVSEEMWRRALDSLRHLSH